jgi:hypothetical protein
MDDRTFIRGFEGFHNTRFLAFTVVAVILFAIVLSGVIDGFRGNHVSTSADAMTFVHRAQPQAPAAPPAAPVR